MAFTTQGKFTAAMQRIADARDLDLVVDGPYSNVGTYTFQRRKSFAPLLSFPFNFDGGKGRFTPVSGGPDPGPLGPRHEQTALGFSRVVGEEFDKVVVRVEELLDSSGVSPEEEFIRIVFSTDDVLSWASDGDVDEALAVERAREWSKHIENAATQLCSQQLCSAVTTGEP